MEVALEYFIVRVRERRKTALIPLGAIGPKKVSLIDLVDDALQPVKKGNFKEVALGKSLSLEGYKKSDVGLEGILMVGAYGLAGSVIDVNDGSKAFDKAKHHAEQVPFYFRLHISKGADQGVLILQRLGPSGINGIVRPLIRDHFNERFGEYMLDIAPMVPDFVFQQYMTYGRPKSVTFIKNSIPADYAEVVSGKTTEQKGSVEVTIKSPNPALFQPKKLAANKAVDKVSAIYSFEDFEPDTVKMKVEVGGHTRTINLNNHANMRASFDISDRVDEDKSGYPHVKDVADAAQSILKEVAKAAGVKI
jgi:hypothetical protein